MPKEVALNQSNDDKQGWPYRDLTTSKTTIRTLLTDHFEAVGVHFGVSKGPAGLLKVWPALKLSDGFKVVKISNQSISHSTH